MIEADLRGADLEGADLQGANLDRCNVSDSSLFKALNVDWKGVNIFRGDGTVDERMRDHMNKPSKN